MVSIIENQNAVILASGPRSPTEEENTSGLKLNAFISDLVNKKEEDSEVKPIFRIIKMRPTPFSDFFPESYRQLINSETGIEKPLEYWKNKYTTDDSFYAREYAKLKYNELIKSNKHMAELNQM